MRRRRSGLPSRLSEPPAVLPLGREHSVSPTKKVALDQGLCRVQRIDYPQERSMKWPGQ